MPFAIHGVRREPTCTRPSATSSHACGAPSKLQPCSQIQRAACSAPQLWPTMPGQHRISIGSLPGSSSTPSKRASGAGLVSFVRGNRVR